MTIDITADDIAHAWRQNGRWCPIACALKRKGHTHVFVYGVRVFTAAGGYQLPLAAVTWLRRFDAGKPVRPVRFRLRRVVANIDTTSPLDTDTAEVHNA